MSLKSIKSNYVKFLQVLKDKGMTLDESQKQVFDGFMGAIENTITQTRDDAIRTTKRLVEEKMEKEYKTVFESILGHNKEHSELTGKIQQSINESKSDEPLVEAIDAFLDEYVEQILPKKAIVDYERLEKLERIQESLKDLLQVKESTTEETPKNEEEGEEEKKVEEKPVEKKEEETKEVTEAKKEIAAEEPKTEEENGEKKTEEGNAETLKEAEEILTEEPKAQQEEETVPEDGENVEKNLEEAIDEILATEKEMVPEEKKICSKDAEGTGNQDTDAEIADIVDEERCEDEEPRSVQVTNETMQMWIDAINRTTPEK